MNRFTAYRTFQDDDRIVSRFVEMSTDQLDPGEVVIRTEYSSVNYKDAVSHNGTGKIIRPIAFAALRQVFGNLLEGRMAGRYVVQVGGVA